LLEVNVVAFHVHRKVEGLFQCVWNMIRFKPRVVVVLKRLLVVFQDQPLIKVLKLELVLEILDVVLHCPVQGLPTLGLLVCFELLFIRFFLILLVVKAFD
jgi:hypothetical protein